MRACETTADMKRRWCGLERKEKPMVRALKMRIALELEICRNMARRLRSGLGLGLGLG